MQESTCDGQELPGFLVQKWVMFVLLHTEDVMLLS